jgi:hypothetical protein
MIVSGSANPLLLGQSSGYNLTRSLRLRASASATLSRTFSTPTSNQKMTLSCWVKLGSMSQTTGELTLLTGGDGTQTNSTNDAIQLRTNGTGLQLNILCKGGGSAANGGFRAFAPLYRDYAGWYHVVLAVDTTQASAANRYRGYVNGVELTSYTGTDPNQNVNIPYLNTAVGHFVGKANEGGGPLYTDAYLAEQIWVDGQQLTPSSFGSTNALTGVWQPARYTGTYGTNGFYLPFTDNSGATSTTIGKDFSGNSNNWTPNNISVTAGATYDSMTDVPTLTSATAANFAVFNPIEKIVSVGTPTDGNLSMPSTSGGGGITTIGMPSGKFYCEFIFTVNTGSGSAEVVLGDAFGSFAVGYRSTGTKDVDGTGTNAAYGSSWTTGDVIGIAADITNKSVTFYKNNVSQGAITYTGANLIGSLFFFTAGRTSQTVAVNGFFGQQGFTYTPPTGFVALNTYNLPTSTILAGNKVMDATLWTGTGTTTRSITNAAGFKPDLVWLKRRDAAISHVLANSVVGGGANKGLSSNTTDSEASFNDDATNGYISSFDATGFSTYGTGAYTNGSGSSLVAWQWQAGQGSSSSNTNGSITSTVSVNASAGFSVVTYTGVAAARTVGHGLGVAPQLIIGRSRTDSGFNWAVWHISLQTLYGNNAWIRLNTTAAYDTTYDVFDPQNNTSSVFGIGAEATMNASASNFVAYCWTPIAGYSAFGSYTGNGSADGAFVYTGFRPRWIMIKRTDTTGNNWVILDTARDTYNASGLYLYPNLSASEDDYRVSTGPLDILSNGFKARSALGNINASSATYIYAAFAENPFKNSLAR